MGLRIFTAGAFDLFHAGHVNILKKSKALGDYLIVAVSTDDLIKSYKKYYPAISYSDRIKVIKACKYVDKVIKQTSLIDIKQLKKYKIDIVTIGDDWKDKYLEGIEWAKKHLKVIYIPYTQGISSRIIKRRIKY
jgi:glycerol-3-phosphate cytidylyltransferase